VSEHEAKMIAASFAYLAAVDNLVATMGELSGNEYCHGLPEETIRKLGDEWNDLHHARETMRELCGSMEAGS